jgi:urease accessory protein UreH
MAATDFIAGPVHIDGYQLHFFVNLARPAAALELLAAAYTAFIMQEKKDELLFDAYRHQHTRKSEDSWYALAQARYELHLRAMAEDPAILRDIAEVVRKHYFKDRVPGELAALLRTVRPFPAEACHAA